MTEEYLKQHPFDIKEMMREMLSSFLDVSLGGRKDTVYVCKKMDS